MSVVELGKSVQKIHTQNINAFEGFECGYVRDEKLILNEKWLEIQAKNKEEYFNKAELEIQAKRAKFDISRLKKLPKVDILYTYSNDGLGVAAKALFESGTRGLVIAGSGAGSIHSFQKKALKALLKKGLKVVVSSRVKAGFVAISDEDKKLGFISAQDLNPQKARVLLMLALTKTNDNAKIAKYFERH